MNEETTDCIVGMSLNYYDNVSSGERHYDIEGLRSELEDHIIGIIAEHKRKGIKINKEYLDILEEAR